jgi:acetyltransferase
MALSSYPDQYEIEETTKGGLKIVVRPMKADDGPLLEQLFYALSPKSIYFRFFVPVKSPSKEMLAKLTQVDHERHVVLAATQRTSEAEKILGVFRLMCGDDKAGELAVVVGDPWQGKGVGAKLFEHGIGIARERGIQSIVGTVLSQNETVLALARKLGFSVKWNFDTHAYDIKLDLKAM